MSGAYLALDKLRREKVVKAIGFGINEADTCVKFAKAGDFDVAMMAGRYTLIDQTGLEEFLPLALEKNMAYARRVFNSGILATGSGADAKFDYAAPPEAVVTEGEGDRGDLRKAQGHIATGGDTIRVCPSRRRLRRAGRGEAGGGEGERARRDGRDPGWPVVGPQVGQASGFAAPTRGSLRSSAELAKAGDNARPVLPNRAPAHTSHRCDSSVADLEVRLPVSEGRFKGGST